MKKRIALLLVGLSLGTVPAVYAGPVQITGDVSLKYERDTADQEPDSSGLISTLKLMGEADLGSGWALYARLGVQTLSRSWLEDFNRDYYGADEKSVAALDQFGLLFKDKDLTYKLGRQDVTVGTTALLYARPDSNVGRKAFVDGLSVTGTLGDTEISALLAKEDNAAGAYEGKIYAVRTGFNPREDFNWGLTLARYKGETGTNHWAVDGTYKPGRHGLTAEYTQSSSDTANKAHAVTWSYDADARTVFSLTNFRVEENGDMGGQSDFDNGNRGWYYGLTHQVREDINLELVYKDQRLLSDGSKNSILEATLSYAF